MKEIFINKLSNQEYISNNLYEIVLNENSSIIPNNFDIDNYNNKVLEK